MLLFLVANVFVSEEVDIIICQFIIQFFYLPKNLVVERIGICLFFGPDVALLDSLQIFQNISERI